MDFIFVDLNSTSCFIDGNTIAQIKSNDNLRSSDNLQPFSNMVYVFFLFFFLSFSFSAGMYIYNSLCLLISMCSKYMLCIQKSRQQYTLTIFFCSTHLPFFRGFYLFSSIFVLFPTFFLPQS